MGFLETVLEGVINAIEQDMENQRKRFIKAIKNIDDERILNTLERLEREDNCNDYRYDLLYQEARRRVIL